MRISLGPGGGAWVRGCCNGSFGMTAESKSGITIVPTPKVAPPPPDLEPY